jgi:hypothetical protein
MTFEFLNRTNGVYDDSHVFWKVTIHISVGRRSANSRQPTTSAEPERWLQIATEHDQQNWADIGRERQSPKLQKGPPVRWAFSSTRPSRLDLPGEP